MKYLVVLTIPFLFLYLNCTGADYGVDGANVIPRREANNKINDAMLIKFSVCGFDKTNSALLSKNYSVNARKNLDGAFYATKDVDSCVNSILLGTCQSALLPCSISPKDFIGGGGLFEGGF